MQTNKTKIFVIVVLSSIVLLQACTSQNTVVFGTTAFAFKPEEPPQHNRPTEVRNQEELAEKGFRHPNDLPRIAFTTIPDVEITIEGDSPRHRGRPRLTGNPQTVGTEHFLIHYTLTGIDKVPDEDANNNDIPDYVEEVAKTMEYVWEIEVNYFGWPAPPEDDELGGDDRYDIYLEEILGRGIAGLTEGANNDAVIGDNPNSPDFEEIRSAYSSITLDNDYAELEEDDRISSLDLMRVTAAHEFLHAIQYGYDGLETLNWLWESTATWMEDEVFDGIDDVDYWSDKVFKSPDTCQAAQGGTERVEDRGHWYAMWVYIRYLSENYGHSIVQDLWVKAADVDGYRIIEETLEERNLVPQEVLEDYFIALLIRDFENGDIYPTVRLEGETLKGSTFTPVDGVDKLGADYVEIIGNGPLAITLMSDELEGIIVGVVDEKRAIHRLTDGSVNVDADAYDHLYLIVINYNEVSFDYNCEVLDYQVHVSSGTDVQEATHLRPAPYFAPPEVEGLKNPDEE
ncbi:MAG: hypothetical protein DWQ07_24750 [Chloroflexi bacterium]|nr:MAG: hypothetical protein DWQ07_24750 [Chloroflexota bacterium]MBL1197098.1 hypothetical protein [Chloroflexota bacterium]NOH14393.1 hypothetical protein [Chloroflexota bacterium]